MNSSNYQNRMISQSAIYLVSQSRRHKLNKSSGDPRIFRRCLFFEIGSSLADFLDLEPSRKVSQRVPDSHRRETVRSPFDFLRKWPNFRPMSRRCPRRRSSGGLPVTVGAPVNRRQTTMNPAIIGRSLFGQRAAIDGFCPSWIWKFGLIIFTCL